MFEKIYNMGQVARFIDSEKTMGFKDSSSGIVLARNLTAINPTIFEAKYAGMSFMNTGVNVDNTGGYANFVESLKLTPEGDFANSSDRSAGKGKISLKGGTNLIAVEEIMADATWTDTEIKQSDLQNVNLVDRYMRALNQRYSQKIDEAGYVGINGNKGLLNYAGFTATNAGDVATALTGEELYIEISGLITAQRTDVDGTPEYSCNTVVMPTSVLNTIGSVFLNTAGGSMTVLSALKQNFPDVMFLGTFRASDVGGVSKTVAFSSDENSMAFRVPVPMEIGEIVKKSSFEFEVSAKARLAGLDVLENKSARVLNGL